MAYNIILPSNIAMAYNFLNITITKLSLDKWQEDNKAVTDALSLYETLWRQRTSNERNHMQTSAYTHLWNKTSNLVNDIK